MMVARIASATTVLFALFHLYTGIFGTLETMLQRATHLHMALLIIFLARPQRLKNRLLSLAVNAGPVATVAVSLAYLWLQQSEVQTRFAYVSALTPLQTTLGILMIACLVEGTRRLAGWPLPVVVLLAVGYHFAGAYLPGILHHAGYSLNALLDTAYLTTDGMFGIPVGASATYIVLFVLLGALMEATGLTGYMMNTIIGLVGGIRGGPAKAAVIASGFIGGVSGSSVSDVMTVGTITIPLMKRMGFAPHFAAAVEAVASTGAQFMPPVLGVLAFLMAEYTGIPYIKIAGYFVAPAVLYYVGLLLIVHFESVRLGLKGLPRYQLPSPWENLCRGWRLIVPLAVLVTMLMRGYGPSYAVVVSMGSLLLVAQLWPDTRLNLPKLLAALESGAKGALVVAVSTGCAGLVAGIMGLTGVALRFTQVLSDLAGSDLVLSLVLTAAASLLLGVGLPPAASYIVQVAVTIPAVVKGLTAAGYGPEAVLLAHMFVTYYASMAVITPPDAFAAFAAAGIANADPLRTGLTATLLGCVAVTIPFVYVLHPALIGFGTLGDTLAAFTVGLTNVLALSLFVSGHGFGRLNVWQRGVALLSAGLTLTRSSLLVSAGLLLLLSVLALHWFQSRRTPGPVGHGAQESTSGLPFTTPD